MKISDVAGRAGVTIKAIRYYESLGLVTPRRLANGYRDYDEHDVRVVAEIRALSGLGIAVDRTRPFLDCLASGREHADDCPASLAGYRAAIDELTERIDALSSRRRTLVAQLREAAHRNGGTPPPDRTTQTHHGEHQMSDLYRLPENLPVPQDDGAADHLVGRSAPELTLAGTDGKRVALAALGTGRTVLYLYPLTGHPEADLPDGWDAIPGARGCTTEACDFRDHHQELLDAGARRVFGLSSQDTAYQRELVERLRLPFAMLSDTRLALAAALDLPTFEVDGMTLFKRITLVVRDGVIEHVFYPIFPPNAHAGQVLAWLREHPEN
ncbi:Peroxiredoxin [Streptacidiphilus jiangxiensis]|uniref:Peroxiredoxin n=2 Tax=Streptacidiphilus jiangxiensis TaxID=235985 RepID=A0A1H7QZ65_STRJI|nr:redoxin family protein [Streptacidiphilus jiangxiensis]SEL53139.1 Peroxiredoxin [Streptacidiphilus jiangxiensis]